MARIQKRTRADGRPVWVVKFSTPDGRERSKGGFATKKAADSYATKQEEAKLRGVEFDPKAGATLFRDQAAKWLASRTDLKNRTLIGYREMLAPAAERRGDMRRLGIDAVFGGYPLNRITRDYISDWVRALIDAGKRPSTIRHAFFVVRMILEQAVVDGSIPANPAEYVKVPTDHSLSGGTPGIVDDPSEFLTAAQVDALVAATPWPYNIYVHVAAWAGLRSGEICGLQVGDVSLPERSLNPNVAPKPGLLRIDRTIQRVGTELGYTTPKTRGSRRRVPLPAATAELLRGYLAMHPRRDDPTAPLFPGMRLTKPPPARVQQRHEQPPHWRVVADRQTSALADLSVETAEQRLVLDWASPLRHTTFYKAVYRPAIFRANRIVPTAALPEGLRFHALRHTYASLCVAAGIPPLQISRFMGHRDPAITLGIYTHLFQDDHSDAMSALGAMGEPAKMGNVIPLRG